MSTLTPVARSTAAPHRRPGCSHLGLAVFAVLYLAEALFMA